ncbi:FAD-dependent oxidoreductase [Candidatus Spongiihabitans sp.]|uniref:FAD-dependent oxidoreductase n=1 Tax=Candidatus Spongiihabitans sp. TaxID=3101308 RepID=UPI003C6FDB31
MTNKVKIAAYMCKGCGLGERLDTEQLVNIAQSEGGADICKSHDYLCSSDGIATIRNDIDSQGVTHVVIGACSRRSKTEAFNFIATDGMYAAGAGRAGAADDVAEGVAVARANLREGVIWSQPDSDDARELTQDMADDYVRMACAEAKFMQQPEANPERGVNKRVLVVGGGISGITAALEIAKANYEVLLVEKTAQLGGWTKTFHRRLPAREPYAHPQDNDINELINQIEVSTNITVFLNATLTKTSGAPGQFAVDITTESGATATENVGALVQASGFTRYDASQLPEFSYGKTADVVDQIELEALAKSANGANGPNGDGGIARPSDGKVVESVVFVQCAGQRSDKPGHLPYCSGYCCNVSIKQAMYFKDQNPDIDTNVIYTDLRVPGNGEDFYRSAQLKGVVFTNGSVNKIEVNKIEVSKVGTEGNQLSVNFHDHILDQDAIIHADLVVLATGQVPNSGVDIDASIDNAADDKATNDKDGQSADGVQVGAQVKVSVESILNLDYRQGPDLPHLKHGFSDSHFICFPYETRRTGIYACGPVRRPMDIQQSIEDATGAAMKAIQAVEGASMGRAAHPRSGDLSYPSFRKEGCTQCKRCTVECPFGAIDEDENHYPVFNESRCRRCGTCMGACPVRVISFENYSVDTVGQQIKAIDMPDEFDEKPRILILACENDAYPALDMAAHNCIEYNAFVRIVPVRCLGSVNLIWVTDAINAGFDGIMMMGCKKGEDYQCHFVSGSELAHERMSKIDDTLSQLQLEPERVRTYEVEITDIERVPKLINDYAAKIDEIGMNPFKGF